MALLSSKETERRRGFLVKAALSFAVDMMCSNILAWWRRWGNLRGCAQLQMIEL
jgi:hypothetical protein